MLPAGCPAPCSRTLRIDPRSTLSANASRNIFSSADFTSRLNTSAINSMGREFVRSRPSSAARWDCSGATSTRSALPKFQCGHLIAKALSQLDFNAVKKRTPAPTSFFRGQRQLLPRLPVRDVKWPCPAGPAAVAALRNRISRQSQLSQQHRIRSLDRHGISICAYVPRRIRRTQRCRDDVCGQRRPVVKLDSVPQPKLPAMTV